MGSKIAGFPDAQVERYTLYHLLHNLIFSSSASHFFVLFLWIRTHLAFRRMEEDKHAMRDLCKFCFTLFQIIVILLAVLCMKNGRGFLLKAVGLGPLDKTP